MRGNPKILANKRIYVVEDNVDNIYVLLFLLRQHGAVMETDWWASGEQSRVLDALPLDLIILDLMLPKGRSGFDVFDELRSVPEIDGVPILALSALDPSSVIPKAMAKGFSGFISKPIDHNRFPLQIAALIDGEQVWDEERP